MSSVPLFQRDRCFQRVVGGASGSASDGFGVVSGSRSSSSLHCVHNACEIMFAASKMVSPLVLEGAVVSEGQYIASGGFGVVSGVGAVPRRLDPVVHLQSPSWSLFSGDSSECFGKSSVPAGFLPQTDTDK